MPTELLIGLVSGITGYLLRPLGEFMNDVLRRRQETADRRTNFQIENLVALQESLEIVLRGAISTSPVSVQTARARIESLAFRVRDDRLRELMERYLSLAEGSEEWRATYGDVTRRMGEVLREI